MEATISKELQALGEKIEELAAQRDEARKQLRRALEEADGLKRELAEARKELHRNAIDIEFLTVSHKLAVTPEALAKARATVRRMIAGVDRALALLKEDAAL